jgi:hypothetical protein
MSDSIMVSLGLASFDVTVQPHLCKSRSGKEDRHAVCVQGMPVLGRIHLLWVWVSRSRCRQCGHVESQKAGFVAQGHQQHDQDQTNICLLFQGHPVLLLQDLRELPQALSKLAIPQNADLNRYSS